jgi:AcrR family transcriptional regulator
MSRPRSRPTREETRQRLIAAGVRVFAAQGISAASIEDIAEEAGFTRGAFYSNFADKDALIDEIYRDHGERTVSSIDALIAQIDDPGQLQNAATDMSPHRKAPLDAQPLLYTELLLYNLRDPLKRPRVAEQFGRTRAAIIRVIETVAERQGRPMPRPSDEIADLLTALDTGVSLHSLIQPERFGPQSFTDLVRMITDVIDEARQSGSS